MVTKVNSNTREKPYLDFYETHKIIPVNQDISNIQKHFSRRNALYRHLGVPPSFVRDKSVIEFGPGSGDNAIHTASLSPAKYVLVDGNSTSVKLLNEKKKQNVFKNAPVSIVHSNVLQYADNEQYDLVICEGIVPNQENSTTFLQKISKFCKPGGVLFTTTHSEVSILSEICRRVLTPFLVNRNQPLKQKVEILVDFFKQDLNSLKGMSRFNEDWVQDSLLTSWGDQFCFSMEDAIESLNNNFDVYGTSPLIISDWRWYKSITDKRGQYNQLAKLAHQNNIALFLDYKSDPEYNYSDIDSHMLIKLSKKAFSMHQKIVDENNKNLMHDFIQTLSEILVLIKAHMPDTYHAYCDYIRAAEKLMSGDKQADLKRFCGTFGRGQLYVSFIRN